MQNRIVHIQKTILPILCKLGYNEGRKGIGDSMLYVVLVCSGGLSANILMKKISAEAEKENFLITIKARSLQDDTSMKQVDIILLSPQASYARKQFLPYVTSSKQLINIHSFDYSSLNAKKILKDIKAVVEKEEVDETNNS